MTNPQECPECGLADQRCDCQRGWLYDDDDGKRYGWCNACGEEAEEFAECCDDGEVVPYGVTE